MRHFMRRRRPPLGSMHDASRRMVDPSSMSMHDVYDTPLA
jgi:hypothetical protein